MRPRSKRRLFWWFASLCAAAFFAVVIVPPFFDLQFLKPRVEADIKERTGLDVSVGGKIRLSLLGHIRLRAENVAVPAYNGIIRAVSFARGHDSFVAEGADIEIAELVPPKFSSKITFEDSSILFRGKEYNKINGVLQFGLFGGSARTAQHKYNFQSNGNEFTITNPEVNLEITGQVFSDGSIAGTLKIDTDKFNEFFEFPQPRLRERIAAFMKYEWNGDSKFRFFDIAGDGFSGEIILDGARRKINLKAEDRNFDLSFILASPQFLRNADFDLVLSGNLKFANKTFNYVILQSEFSGDSVRIKKLVARNSSEHIEADGEITADGAKNVWLKLRDGKYDISCAFSGTPTNWSCSEYEIKIGGFSARGAIAVNPNNYDLRISSESMPQEKLDQLMHLLNGRAGIIRLSIGKTKIHSLPFLPDDEGELHAVLPDSFDFAARDWTFSSSDDSFVFSHKDFAKFAGAADFFARGIPLEIIGNYFGKHLTNLQIRVGKNIFTGGASGNAVNLKTEYFDLDSLIAADYLKNYDSLQFTISEPLVFPMSLPISLALDADKIKLGGLEYESFVWTSGRDSEKFSVANVLGEIARAGKNYKISIRLNKFPATGRILNGKMPLNVEGAVITGQADLTTSGYTSHDWRRGISGDLDLQLDGGILHGLGIDGFYGRAQDLSALNVEDFIYDALVGGRTQLKSLHIVGKYKDGGFKTGPLFKLKMRHSDVSGILEIADGALSAKMNILLRGTSPAPSPLSLTILPDGRREFSVSTILPNLEFDYLREFVATHERF